MSCGCGGAAAEAARRSAEAQRDPAQELAGLLNRQSGNYITAADLRAVIYRHWSKITMLAHRIHEQECSEERRIEVAIEGIAALDKHVLRNLVNGQIDAPELREAFKLIADKGELLDKILADGWRPLAAFEDRDRVVKMWRARGIPCLQVREGNF